LARAFHPCVFLSKRIAGCHFIKHWKIRWTHPDPSRPGVVLHDPNSMFVVPTRRVSRNSRPKRVLSLNTTTQRHQKWTKVIHRMTGGSFLWDCRGEIYGNPRSNNS
jgi:hypothetical protein